MNKFQLEILTPERMFFRGEVESLIIENPDGEMGILANHSPVVVSLQPSIIKFYIDGVLKIASNGEGFIEVTPTKTVVLCQTVEWPEEIEVNRVKKAIEEHERRVREAKSLAEYKLSKATLQRAFARLRLIGGPKI